MAGSMLGVRDSELAVLVHDTVDNRIDSVLGGDPWGAGPFCRSLRLSLFAEHLGCSQAVREVRLRGGWPSVLLAVPTRP